VTKKQCDYSNCGSPCYSYNEVRCEPDCGSSFYECATSCPSGYHVSKKQCDYSNCGSPCYSYNEVKCDKN